MLEKVHRINTKYTVNMATGSIPIFDIRQENHNKQIVSRPTKFRVEKISTQESCERGIESQNDK